jgi:iron complex transport system ATP-binding protein
MSALTVSNAHVRLGNKDVLKGISATFTRGQVTTIVGANGAGKSTLLTALGGLRRLDQGNVTLNGVDMKSIAPRLRAQRLGYLPQIAEVAWAVDVETLVGLGRTPFLGARGLSLEDDKAVAHAMALTGVDTMARRNVMTLSGGERARVLLARVLAGEPQWLLADEPLTGLDPGYQLDVGALFRRMATDMGCGVLVTLHDLHTALRISDRVVVIGDGSVLADDIPARALTPETLARAYGVETRAWNGAAGPMIEIVGRRG